MITLESIGPAARTVIDFPVSVAVNRRATFLELAVADRLQIA
jgi:hypothetical protein